MGRADEVCWGRQEVRACGRHLRPAIVFSNNRPSPAMDFHRLIKPGFAILLSTVLLGVQPCLGALKVGGCRAGAESGEVAAGRCGEGL